MDYERRLVHTSCISERKMARQTGNLVSGLTVNDPHNWMWLREVFEPSNATHEMSD